MPQTSLLSFFCSTNTTNDTINVPQDNDKTCSEPLDVVPENQMSTSSQSQTILSQVTVHHSNALNDSIFIVPNLPKAAIVKVQKAHLPQLKNITSVLFPVKYSTKFFDECIEDSTVAALSRVVIYESRPVGWIRCRLEAKPGLVNRNQIYIQTVGVLAPFRGQGLAAALLDRIAQQDICAQHNVDCIYAHVWEANTDALEWYGRRGFKMILLVEQYYRRLKPSAAWIVRKDVEIDLKQTSMITNTSR